MQSANQEIVSLSNTPETSKSKPLTAKEAQTAIFGIKELTRNALRDLCDSNLASQNKN